MLYVSYNGTESDDKRAMGTHPIKKFVGAIYVLQINTFKGSLLSDVCIILPDKQRLPLKPFATSVRCFPQLIITSESGSILYMNYSYIF